MIMLPVMYSNNWLPIVFNDFFNGWTPSVKASAPAMNVKEDDKAYTMEIAVPGIKKEFCKINLNAEGNLTVAIENKVEHKEETKNEGKERYLRHEFCYSNYHQTYVLPENVVKEDITAKVESGVLNITLPKVSKEEDEKKVERQIEIE